MRPRFGNEVRVQLRGVRHYFFLPVPKVGCQPAPFWLGAAAITLIFSFLGFLASRLLLCSLFAMSTSLGFDGYVGIAYPQSPIDAAGNAVVIKLGLRPGDSERKNGAGRSRTCHGRRCLTPRRLGISLDIATQRASAALITAHPWLPWAARRWT